MNKPRLSNEMRNEYNSKMSLQVTSMDGNEPVKIATFDSAGFLLKDNAPIEYHSTVARNWLELKKGRGVSGGGSLYKLVDNNGKPIEYKA